MGELRSSGSGGLGDCPGWCDRGHSEHDHPEDRVHRSRPVHTAVVTGRPWLEDAAPTAVQVVARLVQQPGDPVTWLDVAGEDDPRIRFTVTAESGRQLVAALAGLLTSCPE